MQKNYSWYNNNTDIHSPDLIHQILAFGSLEDIKSLKKKVGVQTLRKSFVQFPKKVYNKVSLNFIRKIILHLDTPVDEQKYLKDSLRNIR